MRFRAINACFLVAFLAIVCGTLSLRGLAVAGVGLPDWLGVENERSYLEGRAYGDFPEVTVDSLLEAEFQDEFEQYVSDLTPMKDSAMLMNARLQRLGIETAATVFGYEVYPTFFGSDYSYDRESDSIVRTLSPVTDADGVAYGAAADVYSAFAERHDDLDICFYRVDRVSSASCNPTHELLGETLDTEFLTEHFFGRFSDDIAVVDGTFDSFDSMIQAYFRTDHHWTAKSAFNAYVDIAEELGLKPMPAESLTPVSFDVPFYGALTRSGLCLPEKADSIEDYWFDLSHLEVTMDGKEASGGSLVHYDTYVAGEQLDNTFVNHYAAYYHSDYGFIEIRNPEVEEGVLLLVADSFSNNMERFFTPHYREVLILDPRHTDKTIEDILAEHEVDDLVFLLGSTNIATERTLASLR